MNPAAPVTRTRRLANLRLSPATSVSVPRRAGATCLTDGAHERFDLVGDRQRSTSRRHEYAPARGNDLRCRRFGRRLDCALKFSESLYKRRAAEAIKG